MFSAEGVLFLTTVSEMGGISDTASVRYRENVPLYLCILTEYTVVLR